MQMHLHLDNIYWNKKHTATVRNELPSYLPLATPSGNKKTDTVADN